jgi:hypothetical protein
MEMNIRIAMLCVMLVSPLGFAQESRRPGEAAALERAAMFAAMPRGKQITGDNGLRYQHLPEVAAVARSNSEETPEQAIARVGASGAELLETKGNLVLYRVSQQRPANVDLIAGTSVFPAVLNLQTTALGVLTGTQVVRPKNMAAAAAIGRSHGLDVIWEFPHLRTVFYRVKGKADIADIAAALQADSRVESAYPEIIEYVNVPH